MTKRYSFFQLILPILLFVIPSLLCANGEPAGNPLTNGPGKPDSLASKLGHCNPITFKEIDCVTKTIKLSAFVSWTFTGLLEPVVATWNTGEVAHKITVVPPGAWNWDPASSSPPNTCEMSHWDNTYSQPGTFFDDTLQILGPLAICAGGSVVLTLDTGEPPYDFNTYTWNPPSQGSGIEPYEVFEPGLYTLNVKDDLGCPFMDVVNVPLSPPVNPILSGPPFMCPEGDTSTVQVNQIWNHYAWSNGDTTKVTTVYEPGTYDVTVTNQYGCTGVGYFGVQTAEVNAFPISMTAAAICVGQKDTLRVVGGFSNYSWSNGIMGITNIVTMPGTYTVTVTNVYGCTGTGSVTIGLKPTPTIAITSTPFCPGTSSTLTVTGGNFPQYLWSGGETTNPITASVSGTYSVTVSGAAICATNTSVSIVQSPPPNTVISPPAQLNCAAPQTVLNAAASSSGPGFTFVWSTAAGGHFVSGQNTLTPTVDSAGTYILLITNSTTGCTSSTTVTVTSNMQAPPAPPGNPATLNCTILDLNIGPAIPPADTTLLPVWTATAGGNIFSGQNTWNPNVNQPGTYILTVTNPANSCTSTGSVVIAQNTSLPTTLIAPPSQITCTMNTVPLNGSGSSSGSNFTYLWTTLDGTISGSTNTAVSAATAIGTYTLIVTNTTNTCTSSASVTVTADQNIPIALAQPPATLTCVVQTVPIDATLSSSGLTFTYTWTGPSPTSITSGQGTLQPVVNEAGTYTLVLFNNANSCSATLSVIVPEDVLPPTANAGQNSTLNCVVPSLNLDGTASSTGSNFTYQWTTANGNIVNGVNTLTPTVSLAGDYILQVTNQTNGCISTSSVQVLNDANKPNAVIANPAILTCTTLETIINASGSTQDPNYTYTWTGPSPTSIVGGQGTLQLTVDELGPYILDIVNTVNGCTDTETVTVQQDIVPPVALAGNDGLINCTSPTGSVGSTNNPTGPNFLLQWTTVGGVFTSPTDGPTATISGAGTYTLLITNITNGCTDTDVAIVTADFVPPTVEAGPTFELNCIQTSTVLQGTGSTGGNFTYLWTTTDGNIVSGANTLTPTVDDNGTYSLLIRNTANGCQSTDQVDITVSADVPVSDIASPNLLTCILPSFNLDATASTPPGPTISYTWTATNGGNITLGANTLTPTIDAPGTYTLQVFNSANSCSSTEMVIVPENIIDPEVNAGTDNTLTCVILNLPLQATIVSSSSPGISYLWTTTNGTILSGSTTATPTIGSPGIYTVSVTDGINGCTDTDVVEIFSDIADPLASIVQPETLTCILAETPINGTASSGGAPGFTYQWTTSDGNIVSGATTNQPLVDDPGTYTLLVRNISNGCTETSSVTVLENMVYPTAEAGQSVGLDCDTQVNALNGAGTSLGANFSYVWSTGDGNIVSGGNTLTPQINEPGMYTLRVEDALNGCVTTDIVQVMQDLKPPIFTIAPAQLLTCVVASTPLVGSGIDFGNAPTYTWATTNGNIVSGINTLTAIADAPGIYTLTIVNTQNGCTDVEQVQVTENIAPPSVQTLPVSPLTCSVLVRTLQANASPQALLQWSTLNGNIVSGANTPNPVVDEPGLYSVIATLPLNGCTNTAAVPLAQEMNVPEGLQFLLDPPLCNGTPGLLTVEQIDGGVGPFEYSIDGGTVFFPAQDIGDLQPGNYALVIRDANGCTITENVPVPEPPTPAVTLPPSFEILLGENQELQAVVPPAFPLSLIDQVIWTPTTGLTFEENPTIEEMLNPVAMPFVTTEYKVTILTAEGCKAESRTIIRVDRNIDIYPPNIIWPEDPDGEDNAFTLYTRKGSVNQILSLQIYDRWGEELFVNNNFLPDDPSKGWGGDYKGQPVNPGVFVWWAKVELIDGQVILMKGDVTVVR